MSLLIGADASPSWKRMASHMSSSWKRMASHMSSSWKRMATEESSSSIYLNSQVLDIFIIAINISETYCTLYDIDKRAIEQKK